MSTRDGSLPTESVAGAIGACDETRTARSVAGPRDLAERRRVLAETSHAFAAAVTEYEPLLRIVARCITDVVGDACTIRIVSDDGAWLDPVAAYHPDWKIESAIRQLLEDHRTRIGEGLAGRVAASGQAVLLPAVTVEQVKALTKPEFWPLLERLGISSLAVVPLVARGAVLGILTVSRHGCGGRPYDEEDVHLLEDLADRAALAIDAARLHRELERQRPR